MPTNIAVAEVTQYEINAFKVVNTSAKTVRRGRETVDFIRSSSLNTSKAVTDYKPETANPQTIYTSMAVENTPCLAFATAADALRWAAGEGPGRQVYALHGYARLVIPVHRVLNLKAGWADQAQAFWSAYVMGGNLSRFDTVAAPAGTIAIFGIVSLGQRVLRA